MGLGCRRVSQRALRSRGNCKTGITRVDRDFDGHVDHRHGAVPVFTLARIGRSFYGLMDRLAAERRRHEHQLDAAVPSHFMGRVQNTFYFFGTLLQIVLGITVGWIASRVSLTAGFGLIAAVYAVAFGSALWPIKTAPAVASVVE